MNAHSGSGMPGGYAVVEPDPNVDLPPEWARTDRFGSRLRAARLNGWEIALWAIAVVLIVASVQASVYATQQLYMGYSNSCDSNGVCNTPGTVIYLQAAVTLAPGAFAAGLLSAIIAVALRAFGIAARRRASEQAEQIAGSATDAGVAAPAAAPAANSAYAASFVPPVPAAPTAPAAPAPSFASYSSQSETAPAIGTLVRPRVNTAAFARPTPASQAGTPDLSPFMRPRDGENNGA